MTIQSLEAEMKEIVSTNTVYKPTDPQDLEVLNKICVDLLKTVNLYAEERERLARIKENIYWMGYHLDGDNAKVHHKRLKALRQQVKGVE